MKIVIRAGGIGARLWPKSREAKPKQLQALISDKTMLRETVDRVLCMAEPEEIFVSTNRNFVDNVIRELPEIPLKNIITEPERKDTAAACGFESIIIEKRYKSSFVASLGSDHLIKYPKKFCQILKIAKKAAQRHPDHLFCLGVSPDFPSAGYGYIQLGKVIDEINHLEVFRVKKFTEKPSLARARKFLSAGNYLWNANMFLWNTKTLLSLYKKFLPKMHKGLFKIKAALETDREQEVVAAEYKKFEKIAVDYAIIEKAKKIAAITLDIGWSDIGDFATLKDELTESEKENLVKGEHVGLDTENTLIYGEKGKIIATLGIKDKIIVDTKDALLVCDKRRAQDVKKIVEKLKEKKKEKYL